MLTSVEAVSSDALPVDLAPARRRRWTTPRVLRSARAITAVLVVFGLALGVAMVLSRHAATENARSSTGERLIDAHSLSIALSGADASAAGAFLTTGAAMDALDARYRSNLADATDRLARLSLGTDLASPEAADLHTLTSGIPTYAGLVETARANNRQGLPVGAAYLAEASSLLRTTLLPAADRLYADQRQQLATAYDAATAGPLFAVTLSILVIGLLALVALQWWLSRRFRRTFNVPLLGATILVVVIALWVAIALSAQSRSLDAARVEGSNEIETLTQARIMAQRLRADDELTLVTRDTVPAYQQDYAATAQALQSTLDASASPNLAAADVSALQAIHDQIRNADSVQGDPGTAIDLNSGDGPDRAPAIAARLDATLTAAESTTSSTFTSRSADALDRFAGLIPGLVLTAGLTVLALFIGTRRRLAEYR
jgi:hypothetical protein